MPSMQALSRNPTKTGPSLQRQTLREFASPVVAPWQIRLCMADQYFSQCCLEGKALGACELEQTAQMEFSSSKQRRGHKSQQPSVAPLCLALHIDSMCLVRQDMHSESSNLQRQDSYRAYPPFYSFSKANGSMRVLTCNHCQGIDKWLGVEGEVLQLRYILVYEALPAINICHMLPSKP